MYLISFIDSDIARYVDKQCKVKETYLKNTTVEGYYTLESIYQLLIDKNVNIPIIDLIYNIVKKEEDPKKLLTFLVEKV